MVMCRAMRLLILSLAFAGFFNRSAPAQTITFAAIGDYGADFPEEAQVASLVHSWQPDFVITVGDNNYLDNRLQATGWEDAIGRHYGRYIQRRVDGRYPLQTSPSQRFFPAVGNHDVELVELAPGFYQPTLRGYLDYFVDDGDGGERLPGGVHHETHSYYDFRRGPVHFFVLDSERAGASETSRDEQYEWLAGRLTSSTAPWKLVYFHHPARSSGENGDHETMQFPFAQWGATAVLSGHDHSYERIHDPRPGGDDLLYFVLGLGGVGKYEFYDLTDGSQVRYNEQFGALRVTASDTFLEFQFFAINPANPGQPQLIDTYRLGEPVPEPTTATLLGLVIAIVTCSQVTHVSIPVCHGQLAARADGPPNSAIGNPYPVPHGQTSCPWHTTHHNARFP